MQPFTQLMFCFVLWLSLSFHEVESYPYKLSCTRQMLSGQFIMGNAAKTDSTRTVVIYRDGVALPDGSQYVPNEILQVKISDTSSSTGDFKYMFQVTDASFLTGLLLCNNKRSYSMDASYGNFQIQMPAQGYVNVWAAWAQAYGRVYITNNVTLWDTLPTKSPNIPSSKPSVAPTKSAAPTSYTSAANNPLVTGTSIAGNGDSSNTIYYTLVLRRETIAGFSRPIITVNHTVPGPSLYVKLGQWISVNVINEMGDDLGTMHWHGIDQRDTQYNDGPPGITQCPLNTVTSGSGSTANYFSTVNTVTSLVYKFKTDRSGTYWYHGHFNEQYVDGMIGALIVEDDAATVTAYTAKSVTVEKETILMLTDWHEDSSVNLAAWYLSAASNGNEPIPDAILVNGQFSRNIQIPVNRNEVIRIRVINAAAISMFTFSVDGMPLTVIETDGTPVEPKNFASVTIDVSQRVSIVLDWSKLNSAISTSGSIMFRFIAEASMYRTYDPYDTEYFGLYGTAGGQPFNINYQGMFAFNSENTNGNVNIDYASDKTSLQSYAASYATPADVNLLELTSLFSDPAPPRDLVMPFFVSFSLNDEGIRETAINTKPFSMPKMDLGNPLLYDYLLDYRGGVYQENSGGYPTGSKISGDGANPFVIPYNRAVDVMINNTDGGAHPIHLHGHSFWIIATSEYRNTVAPLRRDVVSVPAMGWAIIRFVSDNPGVWLLHCHIDWHMAAGFIATIVEAPSVMTELSVTVPSDHLKACNNPARITAPPSVMPTVQPSAPTQAPVIAGVSTTYIGCYGDASTRALNVNLGFTQSVNECMIFALNLNLAYFALQYGGECWASNDYTNATKYGLCGACAVNGCGNANCNCAVKKCASGEDCGDGYGNVLYSLYIEPTSTPTKVPTRNPTIRPTYPPGAPTPGPTLSPDDRKQRGDFDWSTYGMDIYRSGMNPYETQIASDTAVGLTRQWRVTMYNSTIAQPVVALSYTMPGNVIRSMAYVGDGGGNFYAIDISDGSIQWKRKFGFIITACGDLATWGIIGSATFDRSINTVYIMGSDSAFYALSMTTGETLWSIDNMIDKEVYQNFGGLLQVDGIIYVTFGSRCDFLYYVAGVWAISVTSKSVVNILHPSGSTNNGVYGGGIWGLGGITAGEMRISDVDSQSYHALFTAVGNCIGTDENGMFCEQFIRFRFDDNGSVGNTGSTVEDNLPTNFKIDGTYNPAVNTIAVDNDFGVTVVYFNNKADGYTSGCQSPLLVAGRKDGIVYIVNAETMQVVQTIQAGNPNSVEYKVQCAWDRDSNILVIPTPAGYGEFNVNNDFTDSGILAYTLTSTCQLEFKWKSAVYIPTGLTIVGPPGKKVVLSAGNYQFHVNDLQTGKQLANPSLDYKSVTSPIVVDGTVLVNALDGVFYGFRSNLVSQPNFAPTVQPTTTSRPTLKSELSTQNPTLKPTFPPTFQPTFTDGNGTNAGKNNANENNNVSQTVGIAVGVSVAGLACACCLFYLLFFGCCAAAAGKGKNSKETQQDKNIQMNDITPYGASISGAWNNTNNNGYGHNNNENDDGSESARSVESAQSTKSTTPMMNPQSSVNSTFCSNSNHNRNRATTSATTAGGTSSTAGSATVLGRTRQTTIIQDWATTLGAATAVFGTSSGNSSSSTSVVSLAKNGHHHTNITNNAAALDDDNGADLNNEYDDVEYNYPKIVGIDSDNFKGSNHNSRVHNQSRQQNSMNQIESKETESNSGDDGYNFVGVNSFSGNGRISNGNNVYKSTSTNHIMGRNNAVQPEPQSLATASTLYTITSGHDDYNDYDNSTAAMRRSPAAVSKRE